MKRFNGAQLQFLSFVPPFFVNLLWYQARYSLDKALWGLKKSGNFRPALHITEEKKMAGEIAVNTSIVGIPRTFANHCISFMCDPLAKKIVDKQFPCWKQKAQVSLFAKMHCKIIVNIDFRYILKRVKIPEHLKVLFSKIFSNFALFLRFFDTEVIERWSASFFLQVIRSELFFQGLGFFPLH